MILDTTFLSQLWREQGAGTVGPARRLLQARRNQPIFTTVVNLAELAVLVPSESDLARFFAQFRILPLHFGAAVAAGQLDRRLRQSGDRLGEADTLIAGIALYNGQPLVSRDAAFDRVPGLRRIPHEKATQDES